MSATTPPSPLHRLGRLGRATILNSTNALAASTILNVVVRFGSNLILTRLLAPEAFGVVLLMMSVAYVLTMLSETGLAAFLLRTKAALEPRYYDTLWTIQVLRGLLLASVLLVMAPVIAGWLGKPEVAPVLRLASVIFVVDGFKSLSVLRERRARRDYHNSAVEMAMQLVTTALTIALAWWLRSYWALVIGVILGYVVKTAATYVCYRSPWHRLRLDRGVARELWVFSRFIAASSVLTIFVNQFDKFFVIAEMPLATAGLYNMAVTLTAVAATFVMSHAARIHFAEVAHAFANGRGGPDVYYRPMRLIRPALLFACAGGVTFGETFFEALFDPRYLQAGTFFSILVIGPLLSVFSRPAAQAMVALGQPRTQFVADLMRIAWLGGVGLSAYAISGFYGLLYAVALVEVLPVVYFTILLVREGLFDLRREVPGVLAIILGLGAGMLATWGYDRLTAVL